MMRFLALLAILALVWLVGLFAFADRVRSYSPAEDPARADGIVVLTGPSSSRVDAAIRLLENGKGDRLLISGVNRQVRPAELKAVTPGSSRLFACCVDLGFEAENTMGNAREIGRWARSNGYDSLIVVTSDYHMPRSLVEIRSALPGVELTPYAVKTPELDDRGWWRAAVTARRMTLEYMKYLTVMMREGVRRISGDRSADAVQGVAEEAAKKARE